MVEEARERRWERKPEERPEELLDAALEVFASRGYRATRLEEIADAAGVTRGTIYYYFKGKDELLTKAVETRIRAIFSGIRAESRDPQRGAAERLRATLAAAWERWRQPQAANMYRLITGELRTEFPALFELAMRTGPLRLWALVGDLVKAGQERGEFDDSLEPRAAARFVVAGLMQQALLHRDLKEHGLDAGDPDALFETAVAVALCGLLPRSQVDAPATAGSGDPSMVAAPPTGQR